MLKLSDIKLPVDYTEETVKNEIAKKLNIPETAVKSFEFVKLSVDARKKNDVHYNAAVKFSPDNRIVSEKNIINSKKNQKTKAEYASDSRYTIKISGSLKKDFPSPVIVGAGPAGLFCGLVLAQLGLKPVILERGKCVEERQQDVVSFWKTGRRNINSNVQFGEGGAGTFSDGKLNTGTKDVRIKKVLEEFVSHGAPKEILYNSKPHIGTDKLPEAVKNIRKDIIGLGGKVLFEHTLTDIDIRDGVVKGITVKTKSGYERMECENLVLALGHSARDTFEMLVNKKIPVQQKAFSVGVRIEHLQSMINKAQYGSFAGKGKLGAADYKLAVHLENGRGVYTFCMCPGGTVVAAASESGHLVTNGMSEFARNGINSNSALLVGITPDDFGSSEPLAGVELQRKLEKKAFELGGGNYNAPVQRAADFMINKRTVSFGSVVPSYTAGVTMANISECLPEYVTVALKEGIVRLGSRLSGFSDGDAILTAVETRSSSPVRILRDSILESVAVKGLYPCGEGAGYAGGIMSAAVDGIKCAELIAEKAVL